MSIHAANFEVHSVMNVGFTEKAGVEYQATHPFLSATVPPRISTEMSVRLPRDVGVCRQAQSKSLTEKGLSRGAFTR